MKKLRHIAHIAALFAVTMAAGSAIIYLLGDNKYATASTRLKGDSNELNPWVFTLTDSDDSEVFFLRGLYVCKLDDAGDGSWGGGTVTLQKLLTGNPIGGTFVNVESGVLVNATADIAWTDFTAGVGFYKWVVDGGTNMSITAHCAKAY